VLKQGNFCLGKTQSRSSEQILAQARSFLKKLKKFILDFENLVYIAYCFSLKNLNFI